MMKAAPTMVMAPPMLMPTSGEPPAMLIMLINPRATTTIPRDIDRSEPLLPCMTISDISGLPGQHKVRSQTQCP